MDTARPDRAQPARPQKNAIRRRGLGELAWSDLWNVLVAILNASLTDRVSLAAAGCAFFGLMALFPALSVLLSAYGLVLDSASVESQMHLLGDLLPAPAFELIEDRVHQLLAQPRGSLSLSLAVSTLLTFWSSATGSKSLLVAVNVAYGSENTRSFVRFQAMGLGMTLIALVGGVTTLAVLVGLRPTLLLLHAPVDQVELVHTISRMVLVAVFAATIALLYRFGPAPPRPHRPVILPGVAVATLLWLIASESLSFYVTNMTGFGATYGSLGAVIGVMLWFYVSAYAVILGAEANAQLQAFQTGN